MIPTYNCASYLQETLTSVLAQDPGPEQMQIEVIDDCSTLDDPREVVERIGRGRVQFFKQPSNLGHTRNFDTCLTRARGHLIHLLHGDDAVRDGFYRTMQESFDHHPEIGAAFCNQIIMDDRGRWQFISRLGESESGILKHWLERIATGQCLQTPAMVVRREVYEKLGGFDHRIKAYGEDWEMWVRIAAQFSVWHEVEPLAIYRQRSGSLTGGAMTSGQNGRDLRAVIAINRASLPAASADRLTRRALLNNARACLRRSRRSLERDDLVGAFIHWREAIRFSRSPDVLARMAFLGLFLMLPAAMRAGKHGRGRSPGASGQTMSGA